MQIEELDDVPFSLDDASAGLSTPEGAADLHAQVSQYFARLNEAADVGVDFTKPIRWYIRSAELVYKQACIYKRENDLERAYILFMKFSNLVLREMPKHKEYKGKEYAQSVQALKGLCRGALDYLQMLRSELNALYLQTEQDRLKRNEELLKAKQRDALRQSEETRKLLEQQRLHAAWDQRYAQIQLYNAQLTSSLPTPCGRPASETAGERAANLAEESVERLGLPAAPPSIDGRPFTERRLDLPALGLELPSLAASGPKCLSILACFRFFRKRRSSEAGARSLSSHPRLFVAGQAEYRQQLGDLRGHCGKACMRTVLTIVE